MDDRPVGIFDSGIGGLTVVARVLETLPAERVIYFGDTARLPYGSKSPETVTRFSREIAHFLMRHDVKAIVVACNSASAVALQALAKESPVPVIGVVEPGARAACAVTRAKRVGVIGTLATIRSGAYRRALTAARADLEIHETATPLFVHLVEEGWIEGDVPARVAHHYLDPLVAAGVDTLILGCTHYPLLAPMLESLLGHRVTLVDSATETARELRDVLTRREITASNDSPGGLTCFASDVADGFARVGARFLGRPLPEVQVIEQSDTPWYER